jgi:hypothetical protein
MPALTLNQAAKAAKKAKSTLLEAINSGRLSATRNDLQQWQIEPSELFRVYPAERFATEQENRDRPPREPAQEPPETTVLLQKEREERERERQQMQATIEDLRRRLDQSETERRDTQGKLTALLTYQPEPRMEILQQIQPMPKTPEKGELWKKLFGKLNGLPNYD